MNEKNCLPLRMTIFANNSCYNYETNYFDEGEKGFGTTENIPFSEGT